MSYQIITDSCSDLTEAQLQSLQVSCANLTVMYNGENHTSFSEPTAVKAFYDEIRGGVMATTAAANPDDWAGIMKPALEEGRDVLVITFSGGMSTTYQSAVIASKDLQEEYPQRKIIVIDSLAAALGQGLLVYHACRKRDEGMGIEELAAWVEENKFHVAHWVTVDDLTHLKRGGRISATSAIVGSMLNIKPIIHVDNDGHLINTAKVRGRKAAMEYLTKKFTETCTDFDTVFIGHGDCEAEAQAMAETIKTRFGVKHVFINYVGAVIGAHTGPGVLVVFFMGTAR